MTTKEMIRCKDCAYLVENSDGKWYCEDYGKEIHEISNEDCPLDEEY